MKKLSGIFLVGMGLLFFSSCEKNKNQEASQNENTAKDTSSMAQQKPKELTQNEKDFLKNAAQGGMLEVQLGKLASQKAASKEVKEYGQMLMSDHSQANEKIKQIANSYNVMVPDSLSKDEQNDIQDLAKLSGAEFDKKFMKRMVKDHKEDINDFEDIADKAQDADIRNLAQQTLPTLREHYNKAQQLEDMVSKENKSSKNKTSMK